MAQDRSRRQRRPDRREVLAALALTVFAAGDLSGGYPRAARAQTPERIVAAGGVVTEVLYALGLQDRLVGVDSTSQFPTEALKTKPTIGYVRALSAEGILSLRPSVVIAIPGSGPPDALALLRDAGARLEFVPDEPTRGGVVARIERIGAIVGAQEAARRLAAQASAGFAEVEGLRAALPAKRRVLFVLSLQNGRMMVGGRNSTADAIIGLAGGINAADAIEGYKPMSDEAILAAAPDVILTMRNGSSPNGTTDELFAMPAFAHTPAAARRGHVVMDGLYLLGFGPRTPAAARDLMAAIYPETAIPSLETVAAP